MSTTLPSRLSGREPNQLPARPERRVREELRDGLAVMAFSAAASSALAVAFLVLVHLVG